MFFMVKNTLPNKIKMSEKFGDALVAPNGFRGLLDILVCGDKKNKRNSLDCAKRILVADTEKLSYKDIDREIKKLERWRDIYRENAEESKRRNGRSEAPYSEAKARIAEFMKETYLSVLEEVA